MYDVKDFLERALRQQRNMLKIYEKQLKNLPEGSLSVSKSKGHSYYRKHFQGERIYLGREDHEQVQELQKRKLLVDISERIKNNEPLFLDFLEKYQDPSPTSVQQSLGKAYRIDKLNLLSNSNKRTNKNWAEQPYRRNSLYPEQLKHKTLRGDYVRSKSEVIIANTYLAKKLLYRCEPLIQVGEKTLAPDFAVLVKRLEKVKYHEHFGMMHDSHYRANAMRKIGLYISNGFRPYEDIIFTFDDLDGNINAQVLDILIEEFMM